ncbi:MAG: Lrp/AsnC family transcriptional regulator [Synergistaceae bacterium]|jgi:Lrp/AsnC family transcriptional regulator for asnA, asnC and gidA|nr:Lrp/AsnC family transcriptional regulator [Synergistaceae bacterium]
MLKSASAKASMVKMDATSLEIIKRLSCREQSVAQIAQELDVSEGTVRNRIARLEEAGILNRCAIVDTDALPGHMVIFIGMKLTSPHIVGKAEELRDLKGVVSVAAVTGSYDIILIVMLNENFGLLEFFNEEFSAHSDGVQSTETFVVYKGFNFKLPYML